MGKGSKMNNSKNRTYREKKKNNDNNRNDKTFRKATKVDSMKQSKDRKTSNKYDKSKTSNIDKTGNTSKISKTQKASKANKNASKCPIFEKCGGCQYLDLSYEKQLEKKQNQMEELLQKYGKVSPIKGMDDPYYYRNKVHAVLHKGKDGEIIAGIYEEGTHHVLPVSTCYIENEEAGKIIQTITKLLPSFKLSIYNEDTRQGLMRHILIRRGHITGQILVVLVTSTVMFPSKNNFVKALRKIHPEITTIVQNINDKRTSMVLDKREQVLYGKGYIEDVLCGARFRISPQSFYQINSVQTENLYREAIQYAQLSQKETVLDAYCGIGTIGILASREAKKVIGVELNKEAVKDGIRNAKINGIENIAFYQGDAGDFMLDLANNNEKVDVVFMDPPRSGSDERFLSSVLTLSPDRIVYISCGPDTLARDLEYLTKNGKYRVEKMRPFDLFPMTAHVEMVVLLSKVNTKK
ncbi:23S rRNA (uracil(1939)-C(5))-methyltransferase RlmD [Anaerosporobacter faecicola]|uniref:23S rRNA (uracil(1939)-C(5))-methyltransferase RlmD n=1 Tax=Anaerosporobacter faecicola TaxID=2718714 RepID=UPI001EE57643|nr:23S rRNA (uracil(1939)-C(5))-methyltransferase RlmD [Anaerosporobacter faecicola]